MLLRFHICTLSHFCRSLNIIEGECVLCLIATTFIVRKYILILGSGFQKERAHHYLYFLNFSSV